MITRVGASCCSRASRPAYLFPVKSRTSSVFLALMLAQAAHSAEECLTKLYAVFAPARFLSGLVSGDLAFGFLVLNICLVAFGLWCWAVPVRSGWPSAGAFMWFWTILELINGSVHSIMALARHGYFPGVATAALLLFFAGWLGLLQLREAGFSTG